MRKCITLLFALIYYCNIMAGNIDKISNPKLYTLYHLSLMNLNFASPLPEDSIINLCNKLRNDYHQKEKQDTLFWIEQIAINSYCLKGDIGLAISKADQMYKDAKIKNNKFGIALSLQAIGDTYMHSNQYLQANQSFNEAEKAIAGFNVPFIKSKLGIQQMHTSMELNDMQRLHENIIKVVEYSKDIDGELKNAINFYIACYQTLYELGQNKQALAYENLRKALEIQFPHRAYDLWKYYINSKYYESINNYELASLYCDSVLQSLTDRNLNAYIKFSLQQAYLYEKQDKLIEACNIHARMNILADSLNISKFTTQLDSLHMIYWVDQMKVENASAHNKMLTSIIFYCIIMLSTLVIVLGLARKKNKQLVESKKRLSEIKDEAADSILSKSLFLSNMSHELKTPLNAIVGFSGLLANDDATDDALKQQCGEVIKQNSDLLLKLINDIVDLSDLKEKNFKFAWEQCDAVALCRSVIDTVDKVKQTPAKLYFKTNLENLTLYTDSGRLQQVLINLLINATKFTSEGSITLKLELSPQHDNAIFTIEDTGCGIPLEKQANIFNRFEKLHEGIQGAGLGLSICQLIIEHVEGNIWIDAAYTNGARFIFTHPIKKGNG